MLCGNGWCIDDQTFLLIFTSLRNLINILLIVNEHPFLFQLPRQVGRSLVIASYDKSFVQEITRDGTHTNASRTYEID